MKNGYHFRYSVDYWIVNRSSSQVSKIEAEFPRCAASEKGRCVLVSARVSPQRWPTEGKPIDLETGHVAAAVNADPAG